MQRSHAYLTLTQGTEKRPAGDRPLEHRQHFCRRFLPALEAGYGNYLSLQAVTTDGALERGHSAARSGPALAIPPQLLHQASGTHLVHTCPLIAGQVVRQRERTQCQLIDAFFVMTQYEKRVLSDMGESQRDNRPPTRGHTYRSTHTGMISPKASALGQTALPFS